MPVSFKTLDIFHITAEDSPICCWDLNQESERSKGRSLIDRSFRETRRILNFQINRILCNEHKLSYKEVPIFLDRWNKRRVCRIERLKLIWKVEIVYRFKMQYGWTNSENYKRNNLTTKRLFSIKLKGSRTHILRRNCYICYLWDEGRDGKRRKAEKSLKIELKANV